MALPQPAIDHYQQQQQIAIITAEQVNDLWRGGMGGNFDLSWSNIAEPVFATVMAGQREAAATGIAYVPAVLAAQGIAGDSVAQIDASRFMGGTDDGRPLETLLHGAVYASKAAMKTGVGVAGALSVGGAWLQGALLDAVRDANRQAVASAITVTPKAHGWVRMMNPPSCKFCIMLAGKFYKWNQGFQSHPDCFPAGTVVSSPGAEAATRRWYEGELVIIRTASGQKLSATGNHPILTDQGWVPASLLHEGSSVVRSTRPDGVVSVNVPDEQHAPSLIEDVWGSGLMAGFRSVPVTAEDFHGDGSNGNVEIVRPDRRLWRTVDASLEKHIEQPLLAVATNPADSLARQGVHELPVIGERDAANSVMGSRSLSGTFDFGHLSGANLASVGAAADGDTRLQQSRAESLTAYPESITDAVFALPGLVRGDYFSDGQDEVAARWDAPAPPFSVETRVAYASRGDDLRFRLSSQVELDRVVEVRRVQWSGHVYNLTSAEGWYSANGLIVSNCDCRHIPTSESVAGDLTVDPYAYFHGLTEREQNQLFGKNDAAAIRDGGDMYRIVNTRGKRGLADNTMKHTAGRNRGWQARRYDSPSKMTIDEIYATAKTRDDAIRLMGQNGFITGEQVAGGNILGNSGYGYAGALGRGGTRKGATLAYQKAVATGVRDPLEPATQTAAERRLHSAVLIKQAADRGSNPFGSTRITQADRDLSNRIYEREIAKLDRAPEQVRVLARLLRVL